nr:putative reverse transcriptase domain-containing protein [Tanacetum cinerariifolium]
QDLALTNQDLALTSRGQSALLCYTCGTSGYMGHCDENDTWCTWANSYCTASSLLSPYCTPWKCFAFCGSAVGDPVSSATNLVQIRRNNRANPKGNGCFECGAIGFKRDCPKLKNKDGEKVNAPVWVYAVGNAKKRVNASRDPDFNVFTRNNYDVKLADGKIVRVDTDMRGCTLNFLSRLFNIDLMPIELGSFNVIICMDWLKRCHAVIVCDEKLVQVPYGNETLTFRGNESNNGTKSRLTVISCSKAQEYMAKGCQVFLAQISAKKEEDRSKGKQLEDIPVVWDYPEVFPKGLPGLPLTRPVEFQIDLIP